MEPINQHIDLINKICDLNHVKSLFVFGSLVRNELKPGSDIDLIVEIDESNPLTYADYYFDLKEGLEKILKRPIDLLEEKTITNQFLRQEIDRTKVKIYGE